MTVVNKTINLNNMKASIVFTLLFITAFSYSQNSDWVYRNPNPQNDFYAVKFFDHNTGYVIGSGGTILKTTNGSGAWTPVDGGTVNELYGMYFFDVNHGYIVGAGGLIMYTSDGGASWTHVVTSNRFALRSVTFVNQNTGFLVGDNGELYKSTIGIYGWIPDNVTSRNLHSVFFIDSLKGFACGDSGTVLKTIDAGASWTMQSVGSITNTCISFCNALTGVITTTSPSSPSFSYRTTDGGVTWNTLSIYSVNNRWNSVSFSNQTTGFACATGGLVMETTNSGLNWLEVGTDVPVSSTPNCISAVDTIAFIGGTNGYLSEMGLIHGYLKVSGGSRNNLTSISFLNENTGFVIGGHEFMNTSNSGANWNINMVGWFSWFEGNDTYPVWVKYFSPTSAYRMFHVFTPAGYPDEFFERSTDGGLTWQFGYGPSLGYINGLDEKNGVSYASVTTSPYIIVKSTGGSQWNTIYTTSSYQLGPVAFANENTGFVLCGGSSSQGILLTSDGGGNWSFTPMNNMNHVRSIQMLPSGVGFMAGDSSLFYRTTDFGFNWTPLSQGFVAYFNQIQFVDNSTGWAICQQVSPPYDTRLYYTPNGGTNFMQLLSLDTFKCNSFSFIDANTGYVCGDSGVVLKTTNGGLTFVNTTSSNIPDKFSLSQNYPNPFNPNTKIKFSIAPPLNLPLTGGDVTALAVAVGVKLIIYDVLGREIATLVNQQMQPGSYLVEWDASAYASGIYFYKLAASDFIQTKKMVLLK